MATLRDGANENDAQLLSMDETINHRNTTEKLTSREVINKQLNFAEKESKRRSINKKYQENGKL